MARTTRQTRAHDARDRGRVDPPAPLEGDVIEPDDLDDYAREVGREPASALPILDGEVL